jgi:integrase
MAQVIKRRDRNGDEVFLYRVRIPGHPSHARTFPQPSKGKAWASRLASQIKLDPKACPECAARAVKPHEPTFSEVVAAYLESPSFAKLKPSSKRLGRATLRLLEARWGRDKRVADLSAGFVHRFQEEYAKAGVGGSWINRQLTYANVALKHATRTGLIPYNPIAGFERMRENRPRDRVVTEAEAAILKAALPAHLQPLFELSFRLPVRQGESVALTWAQVDLEAGCLRFDGTTTKSGRERAVPFFHYAHLGPMLAALPSRFAGGAVFLRADGKPLGRFGNAVREWNAARKTTNLSDVDWHDLKHSAITSLRLDGRYTDLEIAHASDHNGPFIQSRYTHATAERVLANVTKRSRETR